MKHTTETKVAEAYLKSGKCGEEEARAYQKAAAETLRRDVDEVLADNKPIGGWVLFSIHPHPEGCEVQTRNYVALDLMDALALLTSMREHTERLIDIFSKAEELPRVS